MFISNWRAVMSRSYSFLFSAASAIVGAGAVVQEFTPLVVPFLPPTAAVPLAAALAAAAALGRVLQQGSITVSLPPVGPN